MICAGNDLDRGLSLCGGYVGSALECQATNDELRFVAMIYGIKSAPGLTWSTTMIFHAPHDIAKIHSSFKRVIDYRSGLQPERHF